MNNTTIHKEERLERYLRKRSWLLYLITFAVAGTLYFGIYLAMLLFHEGHYWSLLISGLLAHSFFVITMHDGAHKSITKTNFDYTIMNFCAGLIVLPLYTELFKKYHLLHHANTNTDNDPLWNRFKEKMFAKNRILYAILQCLPFVFNLYVILKRSPNHSDKSKEKAIKINLWQVVLSFAVAIAVIILFNPGFLFVLGSFMVMTTLGAIRYWGEHMGIEEGKESNTHWFPLGMGIGNHDVHHKHPGYSWLTLTIGLLFRKMDTNPFKSTYRLFFRKDFRHYKNNS